MSGNGSMKKQESLTEEQQTILKQKNSKIERLQTDITTLSKSLLRAEHSKDKDWAKHITPGVLSVFQDNSSWNKLNLKPGNPLLKQQLSSQELQQATGSSWRKMKDLLTADVSDGDDSVSESEPATTKLSYRDMETYGNLPMEDNIAIVNCKTCHRPILASSFKKHMETCGKKGSNVEKKGATATTILSATSSNTNGNYDHTIRKKASTKSFFSDNDDDEEDDDDHMGTLKQSDSRDASIVKRKKKLVKASSNSTIEEESNHMIATSSTTAATPVVSSKRPPPPSGLLEKGDKKKTKKEKTKAKGTKQKAPLDLDKQCGVIQQPNGLPCTRSLTCKSHSMGAKRAVAGRSQPYDVLLAAYQKKAIGRPQSGAINALTGKNTKVKKPPSSSPVPSSGFHLNNTNINTSANFTSVQSSSSVPSAVTSTPGAIPSSGTAANEEYFDSDEEAENIMQALRSNHPVPLAQKPYFYVKRQRQCYRLRDILLEAITPKVKTTDGNNDSTHHSTMTNSNSTTSLSGSSATTPSSFSQNDMSFYHKSYPAFQQDSLSGGSRNNLHLHQQQHQQSSSISSPMSSTIGFPGIYNALSMDGLSPTSPSTSSVVSSYSLR